MPRRKKSPAEVRKKKPGLRVSYTEHAQLAEAALLDGYAQPAVWMRDQLLKAAKRARKQALKRAKKRHQFDNNN